MILENIRLAFSSMAQSKMRTLLSLLGIVIGVASVVAILNLGESATDSMMESLSSGGLDMLTITPRGAARETEIFTDEFPDALMRNVSGIRTTLPVLSSSASIRNGQEVLSGCSVQGVTSSFFEENALEAYDGAFFTLRDNINRRQAVVLGRDLADELFRGLDRVVLACHVSENFHDDGAFPADLQRGGIAHDGFQFIEQRFRIDIDNLMARVLIGKHEGVRQRTVEAEPPRGALFRQTGQKPLLA